jgi:hypothetical protein
LRAWAIPLPAIQKLHPASTRRPLAAATGKAPETPVRAGDAGSLGKRRSDRVLIAIPIDLSATDIHGVRFTEACFTEMVSLHGASVALPRRASTEHPITLHRRSLDLQVQARVLGQLGIRPGFHLYGIAFTEDAPSFWGIAFPPVDESDQSLARTLLMCSECGKGLIFTLNEIEYRVFDANQRLSFGCETCGRNVVWTPVPNKPGAAESRSLPGRQNRRHTRTKMKAMACIQDSNRGDDIVEVLDISRGGVSFRGSRSYQVNSWIQFAVPYTPGAANIFVSGRIAWRKDVVDDKYEHGVQYVRS